MKKRNFVLTVIALLLVLTVSVPKAYAYFTTYVWAKGRVTIHLGEHTEIDEDYNGKKLVTIKADDNSDAVYVRAQAFVPEGMSVTYTGANWTTTPDGEGWVYYQKMIDGKASTADISDTADTLEVAIDLGTKKDTFKEGDQFNVVIIYEYTASLNADGTPDWTKKVEKHENNPVPVEPADNPESAGDGQ